MSLDGRYHLSGYKLAFGGLGGLLFRHFWGFLAGARNSKDLLEMTNGKAISIV